MRAVFPVLEPNHPRRIVQVLEWKIIHCPETGPFKKASLRNFARSLIERRAEPLGNLNKGLPSAPCVAYPLMRHVHAPVPSSVHTRTQSDTNQRNTLRIHNKFGPQPWSPPQQSLFDSTGGCTLPYLSLLFASVGHRGYIATAPRWRASPSSATGTVASVPTNRLIRHGL